MKIHKILFIVIYTTTITACANLDPYAGDSKIALAKYCKDLKVQISDLRGKPLRRTELHRQYELECT